MEILFKFQYDNTLREDEELSDVFSMIFKFQYDNTLRIVDNTSLGFLKSFKFQYDNTLSRDYKSHSNIILFLLSFVNMSFLLKNKKSLIFQ